MNILKLETGRVINSTFFKTTTSWCNELKTSKILYWVRMKSLIFYKSLAVLWLVVLLCFGLSKAAPRCRPGSMGCRYNIGRSEIPTTVLIIEYI